MAHSASDDGETDDCFTIDSGIGLCAGCTWVRAQSTRRGKTFYRCARADEDPAFVQYPPIPVLRCRGFETETESETSR